MASLMKLIAQGKIQKRTLPGSDTQSTIPKSDLNLMRPQQSGLKGFINKNGRDYVNDDSNDNNGRIPENYKFTRMTEPGSNMNCVESITHVGSIEDLRDLSMDEIKLFEHYKFKDPSDISNNLAISEHKDYIVQTVNANSVVLISGATGCGKSTQVPQYILDDCMSRKKNCNVIVTQPRRIAAISVSKQVNKERCWKSGLLVGYQVGRKKDFDPHNVKILYCTTGILLQKIIKAKSLSEFTHIILDEVHERSLEMDFLLLVIKKLIKNNSQSTRVILMSATANTDRLCDYFGDYYGPPHVLNVPACKIIVGEKSNFVVHKYYLNNLYDIIPSARRMEFVKPQIESAGYETAIQLVKAFDNLELENFAERSSVLIFLPGIFEIEEMHRCMESIINSDHQKWTLIPLHSSITNEEQDRVFEKSPLNYRKIILSTNIAESSITVPDIGYVIDFCLMKQIKNELKSNYSMLVMNWASKSNCKQRAGRVGRVSNGRVYRLVPESLFSIFDDYEVSEMCRCSLSRIILMSKILDMGTPKQLLAEAIDPPSLENIELTILSLKQVGALLPTVNGMISTSDGDITYMGKVMANLPLEPPMSKLIYFGYIFNILNESIIMACGLSIKSIFSQPFTKRLEAYTQKLTWANHSCSDPIAYIGPYQRWLERKPEFDRNRILEKNWAYENFIELSAIRELYDLVDDVTNRLRRSFNIVVNSGQMKWVKPEEKAMACKVILAGSFYPNYFIRGTANAYMDEHHVLKTLDDHDPNRTVYFTGFPNDQPYELYKDAIEGMFPVNLVGKPTAHFSSSNKVFIEFPMSNVSDMMYTNELHGSQLVPGNICFGVYIALKMSKLRTEFKIPLMKPADSKNRLNLLSKKIGSQKKDLQQEILPIKKSILEEIDTNVSVINITVSFFESVSCFWAQLFDEAHQQVSEIFNIVNKEINVTNIDAKNIKIGEFYIVVYNSEKYRAKLINIVHGTREKYRCFLIDFGEAVDVLVENVFSIVDEDEKNKVYSIPALAFQCTIANIRPVINGKLEIIWSDKANEIFISDYCAKTFSGTIYSIVNGVVSFENLKYESEGKCISIPEYLIKENLANRSEEPFASKMDHEKRLRIIGNIKNKLYQKSNITNYIKSPTQAESYTMHHLKGPHSPLEMTVNGISQNNISKMVKIENQSVNSVLLDTNPNDYHERLFVAGNVSMNENERLTLWDSTMMPNIPGIPAIICLLFSPCVEIRYNPSFTKMIGAICGLGYDPVTSRPLFEENDIEITFDTVMDHSVLNQINVIRMLLNKCVNPEDEEGPGDIFELQHTLQLALIKVLSLPTKFKAPESFLRKYSWGSIPKSRLQSPYQDNTPVNHPMVGADVYKLLWGVILSPTMSQMECRGLKYKLCKIQRLKERFSHDNIITCDSSNKEELYCPLCDLTFSNNTSIKMHFNNYQHINRYENSREELHSFYTGPFTDIQHL